MAKASIKLTKQQLSSLTPPETGRLEYKISDVPGLVVRHYHNNKMVFSIHKRIKNGPIVRIEIGTYPLHELNEIRSLALAKLSALAHGIDCRPNKQSLINDISFDTLFQRYVSEHSRVHKKTFLEDVRNYNNHLKKFVGKVKLTELRKSHFAEVHSRMTSNGLRTAANRILALASSICSWGVERDLLEKNPVLGIKKNQEQSRGRFITINEMPFINQAINMVPSKTVADFVRVALYTGARKSNVQAMRWDEINFNQKTWLIPLTKNGTPQALPLAEQTIAILLERRKSSSSEYVFPGSGKTGHLVEPKKTWRTITVVASYLKLLSALTYSGAIDEIDSSGLRSRLSEHCHHAYKQLDELAIAHKVSKPEWDMTDLRIHDLRRTMGSWQVLNGTPIPVISRTLNHKNMSTTAIYARADETRVRDSINNTVQRMHQFSYQDEQPSRYH